MANVLEGTLAPATASFTVGAAAGTVIAAITGFDVGANETIESITPNDGRMALDATRRNLIVGLSVASAGGIAATLTTSAGRTLLMSITVNSSAPSEIAWTPAMLGSNLNLWLDVFDQSTIVNTAGAISQWTDQSGKANHAVQATATRQPTKGETQINGLDLVCNNPNATAANRDGLLTPSTTLALSSSHHIFYFGRLRSTDLGTTAATLIGVSNFGGPLQQSTGGDNSVRAYSSTGSVIETDATERLRMYSLDYRTIATGGSGAYSRVNGGAPIFLLASTSGNAFSLAIGNSVNMSQPANADHIAVIAVQQSLNELDIKRLEGYFAHKAGAEGIALLPSDHPFKTAPPTVPSGTTSTANDFAIQSANRQTWSHGFLAEMQTQSFYGGSNPLSSDNWAYPRDFTPAELTRFRQTFLPSSGLGFSGCRLPTDGFTMREPREVDGATGLIKKAGWLPGVGESLASLFSEVIAAGGGMYPEHWGFPPWFKTNDTPNSVSSWGYGTFWAGGSYARNIHLDSIRTSDPTQFNIQVGLITDYMVNMLEYVHGYVPVRGYGFFNEAGNSIGSAVYGTIDFANSDDGRAMYDAIIKRAIEKIRASSILSVWNGQPNNLLLYVNSWDGLQSNLSMGYSLIADTEVLSTGKTAWQEIGAVTDHSISAQGSDADLVKSKTALIASISPMSFNQNEMEHFNNYLPGGANEKTPQFRCMNLTLKSANYITLGGAIFDVPIIHFTKPIGQTDVDSNTEGYGLTQTRLLAPYDQAPTTPGDTHPTIDHGKWEEIPVNATGVKALLNLKKGSTIRRLDKQGATPAGQQWFGWITPEGKEGRLVVNRTNTAAPSAHSFAKPKNMKGRRYSYDAGVEELGSVNASRIPISLPAWSCEVWVEQ